MKRLAPVFSLALLFAFSAAAVDKQAVDKAVANKAVQGEKHDHDHDHDHGAPAAAPAPKPTHTEFIKSKRKQIIGQENTNKVTFTNMTQMASYVLGVQNVGSLIMDEVMDENIDKEMFLLGARDVLEHRFPLVEMGTAEAITEDFEKMLNKKRELRAYEEIELNKEEGAAFLEKNKTQPGVKVTDTGLQYKVLKEGTGASPKGDASVSIFFRSMTVDGRVFSDTYKRSVPPTVPINSLPKGMQQALRLMKAGGKNVVYIPYELAYGTRDVGPGVGSCVTIIMELELVRVEGDEAAADPKK